MVAAPARQPPATAPPIDEFERCGTLWVAEDEVQLAVGAVEAGVLPGTGRPRRTARRHGSCRVGAHAPAGAGRRPPRAGRRRRLPAGRGTLAARGGDAGGPTVAEGVEVQAIESRAVMTTGGRLEAEHVINAAGAEAPRLTPGLAIVPRKGHLVITERVPGSADIRSSSSDICRARIRCHRLPSPSTCSRAPQASC